MFAVVTKYDKFPNSRRYCVEFLDPVCRISIGSKVSRRRLERLLAPFSGRVIFANNVTPHRIKPFDTLSLRRSVLFSQFYDRVMSQNGISLSVGIIDPAGDYVNREEMTEIIAHSALTTVFTFKNMDVLSREWLLATGTCPEIVEKKALLYATNIIFAPEGLLGYEGELFGLGGRGIDRDSLSIPNKIVQFLANAIDEINVVDLYCMLKNEVNDPTFEQTTALFI